MKKKRIFSALLAACMILTAAVGCSSSDAGSSASGSEGSASGETSTPENFNAEGYPVVNEPIELSAFTFCESDSGDFNTMTMVQEINEKTGVHVTFEQVMGDAYTERKNLLLASGTDLPDIFFGGGVTDSDILRYGRAGVFIPLNDLIDKYAPRVKQMMEDDPSMQTLMPMEDGNIYDLPFDDQYLPENIPEMLFINKTWLETLGLEMPTPTEEFRQVLTAFKENDPNGNSEADEIPFTYYPNATYEGDLSLSGSFGVLDTSKHIMIKDGTALFSNTQDGYKDYIKYQAQLYAEGLLDPEVFTQDSSQYYAKNQGEVATVGVFSAYAPELFCGIDRANNEYTLLEPLEGPNGDRLWNKYNFGFYSGKILITSDNEYPEATMRWADEFYDEEMSIRVHWGEIGDGVIKNDDGTYQLQNDLPDGYSIDSYRFLKAPAFYGPGVLLDSTYQKITLGDDKIKKAQYYEIYDPYTTTEYLPTVRLPEDDQEIVAQYFTDIDTYVENNKAKWIVGEGDVDAEWENYKSDLDKMNVAEYVAVYQRAYDNSKAE